jgi:preprotein translocase SecF subunit
MMFRPIRYFPKKPRIKFMAARKAYYALSIALTIVTAAVVAGLGLNFGIDFKGGILVEIRTTGPADVADLRQRLAGLDLGEFGLQGFGPPTDVLIRIQEQSGGEKAQVAAIEKVKQALGAGIEYRRVESVGPKVGGELIRGGIIATVLALVAIVVYVWFRFEWQFGIWALVSLLHDVTTTVGLYAVTQIEFNLTSIAAILTIAGYSINDTVVVYDRLRENLRKYKRMGHIELLDLSINETLSRTVMTSGTTLLAVLALALFGGEVIRGFSIALLWGILIGTYSSICLASPLLLVAGADALRPRETKPEAAPGQAG